MPDEGQVGRSTTKTTSIGFSIGEASSSGEAEQHNPNPREQDTPTLLEKLIPAASGEADVEDEAFLREDLEEVLFHSTMFREETKRREALAEQLDAAMRAGRRPAKKLSPTFREETKRRESLASQLDDAMRAGRRPAIGAVLQQMASSV